MEPMLRKLGLRYPLFQGGMAWVATGHLAAAVSEAGGLGIIGAGHAPAAYVKEQIAIAKAHTNKPFGVNVMLLSPYVAEVIEVVAAAQVAVVTTGAGDPSRYLDQLQQAGSVVLPVVPSVALASRMARSGVDGVIAEGMESGGHIGAMTTMALVPQVVDAIDLPVIAAGGIADGRGVVAALALGASGVQMGTRFLAASETRIHPQYQQAVVAAKDVDTLVTGLYVGHAARVLKNPMSRQYLRLEKQLAIQGGDMSAVEALGNGSLRIAVQEGDPQRGSFMAGQIAGLVHEVLPAQTILDNIMQEAQQVVASGLQERLVAP